MLKIYNTTETSEKTGIPERTLRRHISNGTNGFPKLEITLNGRKTYGATLETIKSVKKNYTRKSK